MKLYTSFSGLEKLCKKLGARESLDSYESIIQSSKSDENEIQSSGIMEGVDEIESFGLYLTYKRKYLAVAYQKFSNFSSAEILRNFPDNSAPRIHLTLCSTLRSAKEQQRIHRYVLSITKVNSFSVEALEIEPDMIDTFGERHIVENIRLYPCQHCLKALNYKGFNSSIKEKRIIHVARFSLEEFFDENEEKFAYLINLHNAKDKEKVSSNGQSIQWIKFK